MRNRIMILWIFMMACALLALGSVPGLIHYQAFLTESDSEDPLEGPVTLTFSMYDDATDGKLIWQEIHQLNVEGGMVEVMLGSTTPLSASLFDQDAVYLGLQIGDETELPLKRIASVPYALLSDSTLSVDWNDIENIPAGFADGIDDEGSTGSGEDDAGREDVVEDLYEGSTALKDKYIEKFKLIDYDNTSMGEPIVDIPFFNVSAIDHNPIIKLNTTGPGIQIRSLLPGLKIFNLENTPRIKLWQGMAEDSEPDDEDAALQINTNDYSGNGIDINVEFLGTGLKSHAHEGRGVWGISGSGYGVLAECSGGQQVYDGYRYGAGIYAKGTNDAYGGQFESPFGGVLTETDGDNFALKAVSNGSGPAGLFEGDVHVSGDITKAYTSTTSSAAVPIAYGYVEYDGDLSTGTPNVSVSWNSTLSQYEISITGERYVIGNYITVVTPSPVSEFKTVPCFPRVGSSNLKLTVQLFDLDGDKVRSDFQFVTYKP